MPTTIQFTNDGRNLIRDSAAGVDRFIITHFELGSSNASVNLADHALHAPFYRRAITAFQNGSAVGELLVTVYIPGGEGVGINVQELGIFGGNAATSSVSTGVMIGRVLWVPSTNPKTALVSFQLTLDLLC
jgi:hypothetical protein